MTEVMFEQAVDLDAVLGDEPAALAGDGLDAIYEQLIAWLAGRARARLQRDQRQGVRRAHTRRPVAGRVG